MRCEMCDSADVRPGRKPKVVAKGGRVAVVTDVPVEKCPSCGMTWLGGPVARRLDEMIREMIATDSVAIRPNSDSIAA